jgi:hypothetical protein
VSREAVLLQLDTLREWLVRWVEEGDGQRREKAATTLLIEHDRWLRRGDFRRACVDASRVDRCAVVRWQDARAFVDAHPAEAFSDRVMLEVACTLAIGRFEPLGLDDENRAAVVRAVKSVLEVE